MANRTVKDAHTVHGTNPQYLVEKIVRSRIYESLFWKEHCFALTAELLVDKAVELRYIGGAFSESVKPTPFLCLTLKMLQIQPDKDIIVEFIKQEPYKYARALGAFYLRLVGESVEIYKYLQTLYNDFRRLKFQDKSGNFSLIYMDDFIDKLLTEERICDVILPRLQKRSILEELSSLEPRQSLLNEDLEDLQYTEELETAQPEDTSENKDRDRHKHHVKNRHKRKHRERSPHDDHRERDNAHLSKRTRNGHGRRHDRDHRRSRSKDRREGRSKRDDRSPDKKRNRNKDRDRKH